MSVGFIQVLRTTEIPSNYATFPTLDIPDWLRSTSRRLAVVNRDSFGSFGWIMWENIAKEIEIPPAFAAKSSRFLRFVEQ